ncbi:translation initiation factor IF-2 [Candidatus Woesearchaeota archaeon]|nr:translation initiation factor IF-2 [Candidatus Woesearchaeota archaeon]
METRKPIVTIMGHVDHGKTRILDTIRRTTVIDREAGAITQAIGASIVPIETIKRICGSLLTRIKTKITLPGLLFIDTPGHAAFSNLRKRGGNLADIAILVIDINEGIKPQTREAIDILKKYKTPFLIAANKIDLVSGWRSDPKKTVLENINSLPEQARMILDQKLYTLVGSIYDASGMRSERFDRVTDHTKELAIVPTCAKTGDGIAELLMVLSGLAQNFLNECLKCDTDGPAKGTVLEVKEEKGLGKTLDVIIYDGSLSTNDILVIGGIDAPVVTRAKVLLEPMPLSEMRDKKSRFKPLKRVIAATGVKISASEIDQVIAGMPIRAATAETLEQVKDAIQKEVDEVIIETDRQGIVVKADSLGSLEALVTLLKDKDVRIMKATVGDITKKDISDAMTNFDADPLNAVVLGFNSAMTRDAEEYNENLKVIVLTNKVIYRLIEDFCKWREDEIKKIELKKLDGITRPYRIELIRGMVFRQNNPAVCGVEVQEGLLTPNTSVMKSDGVRVAYIKGVQLEQKNIEKAEKDKQVAVSMDGVTIGRQIHEGDILYSDMTENEFRKLKELKELLSKDDVSLLKEIAEIKRKQNSLWGV